MLEIKKITVNPFGENCMILRAEDSECAIVDPGFYNSEEKSYITSYIETNHLTPKMIILTHGHFDHVFGVAELSQEYNIPVYMNPADKTTLEVNSILCRQFGLKIPETFQTKDIKEGDCLSFGGHKFEAIFTPGHTPGGTCWLSREDKILLSGDTLFAGSIGRTDMELGDYDALMNSILNKIMLLDGDIDILPGHGPSTDIASERTGNPFLLPFNESYEE